MLGRRCRRYGYAPRRRPIGWSRWWSSASDVWACVEPWIVSVSPVVASSSRFSEVCAWDESATTSVESLVSESASLVCACVDASTARVESVVRLGASLVWLCAESAIVSWNWV